MSNNLDEAERITRELKANGIAVGDDNSSIRSLVGKVFGTGQYVSFFDLEAGGLVYVSKPWLFDRIAEVGAQDQRDREATADW